MHNYIPYSILSSERWQKEKDYVEYGSQEIYKEIQSALEEGRGSLIGRHGTIELTMLLLYIQLNMVDLQKAHTLETNAGIFPNTRDSVKQWCEEYRAAGRQTDIFAAGWYKPLAISEWKYLQKESPNVKYIPLRSLEPYYVEPETSWLKALEGQRVTVVSSFAASMSEQLAYMDQIWFKKPSFFPKTTNWSFVRSYYCPIMAKGQCQWPEPVESWMEAIDYLEEEVLKTNPKIVLIGCGGLAMILGARLKQKGIVSIVMGGAIQILFGIKGKRWDTHPIISSFYTSDWLYPNQSEIPGAFKEIEGGCYW